LGIGDGNSSIPPRPAPGLRFRGRRVVVVVEHKVTKLRQDYGGVSTENGRRKQVDISTEALKNALKSVGLYHEFDCAYCAERSIFVSGPHSHTCVRCGGHAERGWYAVPVCERCGDVKRNDYPDWDKLLKNLD